ncbi:uncharacterized protein EV422DRAFT_536641 [Fimicolochytrium jonesii]|uniref:uncharacterized protein n=1 Tax=Fimicolochytrium jonesii TaxID=1396493 RepID=UPI0022FEFBD9|nr:uncharacterized protein EV422DRAFT_536641 [Fimicolochytrium jonesii]KAI8818730.1 hypothetical protein EV422DRAFT_536641 [Fimicolochytrium jonesii]
MKLTPKVLAAQHPSTPLSELVSTKCSGMEISHIEDLSVAVNLHKLDLSKNSIKKADALSGIKHNKELTLLNLSGNELESCQGVETLEKLLVLNLSHNQVNRISHHVSKCTALKALILNHNKIARIENISTLLNLNTIVLSHNNLSSLDGLGSLSNLTKLSVAHNQLRLFPDLRLLPALKELRLNDNKILNIPDHIRSLPALEILDMGNNLLKGMADIASLASLRALVNLNLKGNPLVQKEKERAAEANKKADDEYRQSILTLCPSLRVLDNDRFDPKFLERKTKRKALELKKHIQSQKASVPVLEEGAERAEEGEGRPAKKRRIEGEQGPKAKPDGDGEKMEVQKEKAGDLPLKRKRDAEASARKPFDRSQKRPRPEASIASLAGDKAISTKAKADVARKQGTEGRKAVVPAKKTNPKDKANGKDVKGDGKKRAAKEKPEADAADPFFWADAKAASPKPAKRGSETSGVTGSKPAADSAGAKGRKKTAAPEAGPTRESPSKKASQPPKPDANTPMAPDPRTEPTPRPPVEDTTPARSGVLAVVDVKAKARKAVTAFDPAVAAATPAAMKPVSKTGTQPAPDLLVGGWD